MPGRVVDEPLPVGDVDISLAVYRNAFSRALGKRLQVLERAVGLHGPAVGPIFRITGDEDAAAGECRYQPVRIEIVGPPPASFIHAGVGIVRPLAEDTPGGQEEASV